MLLLLFAISDRDSSQEIHAAITRRTLRWQILKKCLQLSMQYPILMAVYR